MHNNSGNVYITCMQCMYNTCTCCAAFWPFCRTIYLPTFQRCMTCALFVYVLYTFPVHFMCRICARFGMCTISVHNLEMYIKCDCPTIHGVRFCVRFLVRVHYSFCLRFMHICNCVRFGTRLNWELSVVYIILYVSKLFGGEGNRERAHPAIFNMLH